MQRYVGGAKPVPSKNGDFVRYDDAQAEIARLTAELAEERAKRGLNVTAELIREHINPKHAGAVFGSRDGMIMLAKIANNGGAK